MGILDPLFESTERLIDIESQRLGWTLEPSGQDQSYDDEILQRVAEATLAHEAGGALVDTVEESILEPLEEEGTVTPENVEKVADLVEGGNLALLLSLGASGSAVEALSGGQVDQHQEFLMQAVSALQIDDVTGMEMDARVNEGIAPAWAAKAGKQHRSKFVDLPDAVEYLLRHKEADSGFLQGSNVPNAAYSRIQSNEPVNPENAVEEWGIRDDQLPILEEVSIKSMEPEELIESPIQMGVLPDPDTVEQELDRAGVSEATKALFRETVESASGSADLWEQRTRADELIPQLDERVMNGQLSPVEATTSLPGDLQDASQALFERWELLADLSTRPPSGTDVESGFTAGLIGIDRATDLLADVDVDPEAHPYILQEMILSELDGDLRRAVGLGLLSEGQYVEYAELVGLEEPIIDRLLQGEDLDDIAEDRLQAATDQGGLRVDTVPGIGESRSTTLEATGVETVGQLADQDAAGLAESLAVSEESAASFIDRAQQLAGMDDQQPTDDVEPGEVFTL